MQYSTASGKCRYCESAFTLFLFSANLTYTKLLVFSSAIYLRNSQPKNNNFCGSSNDTKIISTKLDCFSKKHRHFDIRKTVYAIYLLQSVDWGRLSLRVVDARRQRVPEFSLKMPRTWPSKFRRSISVWIETWLDNYCKEVEWKHLELGQKSLATFSVSLLVLYRKYSTKYTKVASFKDQFLFWSIFYGS